MIAYGARPGSIKASIHSLQLDAALDADNRRKIRRPSIVLLDDDVEILTIFTRMLMTAGYFVTTSQIAEHALAVLSSDQPVDMVISDLVLPGMDGMRFCNQAARLREGMSFIVMTGSDRKINLCDFPPGTHAIYKPFRRRDVLELIGSKLETYADGHEGRPSA